MTFSVRIIMFVSYQGFRRLDLSLDNRHQKESFAGQDQAICHEILHDATVSMEWLQ